MASWSPTVRWTAADDLAHLVSYDHHRFCDGQPVRGCNSAASHPTCIPCAVAPRWATEMWSFKP